LNRAKGVQRERWLGFASASRAAPIFRVLVVCARARHALLQRTFFANGL